jgi:short-subunit dehydrogenase
MRDPHSLTKHAVVTLYESVYLALEQRNLLAKIAVRCPGLVRMNIYSAERNRRARPHHEPVAMIPERPNDAAGAAMREGRIAVRAGQARWLPPIYS